MDNKYTFKLNAMSLLKKTIKAHTMAFCKESIDIAVDSINRFDREVISLVPAVKLVLTTKRGHVENENFISGLAAEFNSGHVSIEEALSEIKEYCSAVHAVEQDYVADLLLQKAVYSHGLCTGYSYQPKSYKEICHAFRHTAFVGTTSSDICGSDKSQRIGAYGVYVKGTAKLHSNRDLWSQLYESYGTLDRTYDRYSDAAKHIISCKTQLDLTVWDHTEHFVRDYEVVGVWFKDWALNDPEIKAAYLSMKDKYTVCHIVGNRK